MKISQEFKTMKKFYLLSSLDSLASLAYAFEIIYLLSIGFSNVNLGILFAVTSLLIIILNIPAGVIADIYSRKLSVFLSYVINGFGILILALTADPTWIIISFIIGAISFTLRSGTQDAWMIDYYTHEFPESKPGKVITKNTSISSLSGFFVYLISSLIIYLLKDTYGFQNSVRLMYFISSITLFIMAIVTLLTKEYYFRKKEASAYFKSSLREARHVIRASLKAIKESNKLLYTFIGGFILVFGATIINYAWPIQFSNNGISEASYGIILAFYNLIGFVILSLNEPLKKLVKSRYNLIMTCIILMGIFFIIFSINLGYALISIFLILSAFWDLLFNNFYIRFNKLAPQEYRATTISLKNISEDVAEILSKLILFGLVTQALGINTSILIGGILIIISGIIMTKTKL